MRLESGILEDDCISRFLSRKERYVDFPLRKGMRRRCVAVLAPAAKGRVSLATFVRKWMVRQLIYLESCGKISGNIGRFRVFQLL
jgi:hypothetical protein